MSDKMQTVKFLKEYLPYSPGEQAGFPPATAEMLRQKGIAAFCDEEGTITAQPDFDQAPIQMLQGPQPTAPAITAGAGGNQVEAAMAVAAGAGTMVNPPSPATVGAPKDGEAEGPEAVGGEATGDLGLQPQMREGIDKPDEGDKTGPALMPNPTPQLTAAPDQIGKDFNTGSSPLVPSGVKLDQATQEQDEAAAKVAEEKAAEAKAADDKQMQELLEEEQAAKDAASAKGRKK